MSLAQSAPFAEPFNCPNCGRPVSLPKRDDALLDERGWAHVPCECGVVNAVPYEHVEPTAPRKKRRPSWMAAVLWIVIIAMIALLLPTIRVVQREPEPPQPPSYMTT